MAEDVAYMAVKSVGLSSVGGRKPCSLLDAARHNLREIQAEMGAAGHIDPERRCSNVILGGPESAEGVQAAADALLASAGVERLRRDHCQAIEFVFSLPVGCSIDVKDYFSKCLGWMKSALPLPVLSAVIHRDESAPHMHVLLLPLDGEGRHVGGAPIGREQLKRLRASFFVAVAGRAGLRREGAKLRGQAKGWAVATILRRCDDVGMPEACGALWPIFRAAIERDPQAALVALKIDPDTIRRAAHVLPDNMRCTDTAQNPIGIEGGAQNPIGIEKRGEKIRSLSCVGIAHSNPAETTTEPVAQHLPEQPIATLAELWERIGCRSVWRTIRPAPAPAARRPQQRKTARSSDRVEAGRRAMQQAVLRGGARAVNATVGRVGTPPQGAADGDGWTRDREGLNEPEPWADW